MRRPVSTLFRAGWVALALLCPAAGLGPDRQSSRDAFNAGTVELNEADWIAAEMLLYSAVTANDETIQPVALYNLGLTRFNIGVETLEAAPDAGAVGRQAVEASARADRALQEGLTAMQRNEQAALIRAYLRGRGARRSLKEAREALEAAMEAHGDVLSRWQRASGDFHSTVELTPSDEDAAHNADVTDRHIARLVDSLRQMQAMMEGMGERMEGLEEMLEELGGRIPDDFGDPGPGEEGDDWPDGPEPGTEEGPGREGDERPISPEDAARLLESFQLDRGRTLPMGFDKTSEPRDPEGGKNW